MMRDTILNLDLIITCICILFVLIFGTFTVTFYPHFFRHGEAILLDETLSHCRTEKCDTFGNEPLCVHEDFACNVVEVYGFQ